MTHEEELEQRRIRRKERAARKREAKRRAEEEAALAAEDAIELAPFTGPKTPEQLRAEFTQAFDTLGGVEGLVRWGARYPKEFYAIWARVCIPRSVGTDTDPTSLESIIAQLDEDAGTMQ